MTVSRVVGLVLVGIAIAAFAWGGVFWTDRQTVIDAGPIEVTTAERKGVRLPPVVGGIALVAGVVLLLIPARRRA